MIKKILVSQPKPSSEKSPYFDIAERYGVEMVFHPFIKVEGLSAREFRQQKISLSEHTAVVFTSRHAIDHFFQLAKELRFAIPDDMKYFCITEQVALYIQKYVQYRKRKIFFGSTGKIADLLPQMVKHKNERYFIPQSDVHTDEIKNLMESKKLRHTEGVMYRTVPNDLESDQPLDFDMVVFFSPQRWKTFDLQAMQIAGIHQGRAYCLTEWGIVAIDTAGRMDTCGFYTEERTLEEAFAEREKKYETYGYTPHRGFTHSGHQWRYDYNSVYLKDEKGWYRIAKPLGISAMYPDPDR